MTTRAERKDNPLAHARASVGIGSPWMPAWSAKKDRQEYRRRLRWERHQHELMEQRAEEQRRMKEAVTVKLETREAVKPVKIVDRIRKFLGSVFRRG